MISTARRSPGSRAKARIYLKSGHFLSAVDSDISMNNRAREVARRIKPRLSSFRRFTARGEGSVTSNQPTGSARSRSRGRGFSRLSTTRGRGPARPVTQSQLPLVPPLALTSGNDYPGDTAFPCPAPVRGRTSFHRSVS